MEQWNGIVEWNTGICIFVSLGYFKGCCNSTIDFPYDLVHDINL